MVQWDVDCEQFIIKYCTEQAITNQYKYRDMNEAILKKDEIMK